jgi:hypothetical protein
LAAGQKDNSFAIYTGGADGTIYRPAATHSHRPDDLHRRLLA